MKMKTTPPSGLSKAVTITRTLGTLEAYEHPFQSVKRAWQPHRMAF
jgi:hypothetical protein